MITYLYLLATVALVGNGEVAKTLGYSRIQGYCWALAQFAIIAVIYGTYIILSA